MTFLAETPPVCGKCYDRDPFCGCATPARVVEQPELESRMPELGDVVEVPVGNIWLPARVTRAATLGPRSPDGGDYWVPCIFNFELVGADHIAGCAYVVDDRFAAGLGRAWRWPGGVP